MLRSMRFSVYVGLIAASLVGMSLTAWANESRMSLEANELDALTQRLGQLVADIDEDTAERLGQIFYDLHQLLEPEDLLTILQLLAVQTELASHAFTAYTTSEPITAVQRIDTLPMATASEIRPLPHPSYALTDHVVSSAAPRQAMIARSVATSQLPVVQHAATQHDLPALIHQLNLALQNPALEWRLPDGTRLRPRIVIELVPIVEPRVDRGRVPTLMPESTFIESVIIEDRQIDE